MPRRVDDRGARRDRLRARPATSASGSSTRSSARPRSAARGGSTSPAPTQDGNVELFMQAGFARYGDERILHRAGDQRPARDRGPTSRPATAGSGRRAPLDALPCSRLYAAATPAAGPASRGRSAFPTGSARARTGGCRASSLAPILRFADVEASSRRARPAARTARSSTAFVQIGVAKEDQPHYLKLLARPEADVSALTEYALGIIRARTREERRVQPRARRHRARSGRTSRRSIGGSRTRASVRSPP